MAARARVGSCVSALDPIVSVPGVPLSRVLRSFEDRGVAASSHFGYSRRRPAAVTESDPQRYWD